MYEFFHKLHFSGEAGLCLAKNDIEFVRLCVLYHLVEFGTVSVRARVIVVGINAIYAPALTKRIRAQNVLLVLNAEAVVVLALLIPVLFGQSAINCHSLISDIMHPREPPAKSAAFVLQAWRRNCLIRS